MTLPQADLAGRVAELEGEVARLRLDLANAHLKNLHASGMPSPAKLDLALGSPAHSGADSRASGHYRLAATHDALHELKPALEALRARERLLKTVFDTFPQILAVKDREGRYLMVNKAWEDVVGIASHDVMGRTIESLTHWPFSEIRQTLADDLNCMGGQGSMVAGERSLTLADGAQRDFYMHSAPLRDEQGHPEGLVALYIDISEEKHARYLADLAYSRLHDAIESLPAAFLLYDTDERLVLWNSRVSGLYPKLGSIIQKGARYEDILRAAAADFAIESQDRDGWLAARLEQFRHEPGAYEVKMAEGRWLRGIDHRTAEGGTVCLCFDISDAKQRELEYQQSQKMEVIGRLTSGIAHDLNNLLQIISGYSEIAGQDISSGKAALQALDMIDEACSRASSLTRQLLAFSRKQPLKLTSVNLNALIQSEAKLMAKVLPASIELRVDLHSDLDPVLADRGMVQQVILNLAVNSRDAMPLGGTISVESGMAEFDEAFCQTHSWARPGKYGVLRFSDTGTGMAPEVLEHIFEPFYTTKEPGRGTGLGLSTVYGIVQQHSGLIHVESLIGQGTRFSIHWPVHQNGAEVMRSYADRTVAGGTETILVADDEDAIRSMLSVVLGGAGYRVVPARDGQEAIDIYREHSSEIAIAILDVMMPQIGGLESYKQLRVLDPSLPVIFISGWFGPEEQQYVTRDGLDVLSKPFSPVELLTLVRSVLDRDPAPQRFEQIVLPSEISNS